METDQAFLDAFERCTIAPAAFRHREHLRMTWLYLRRDGRDAGSVRIVEGLRRFARHHHAEHVFDRALTDAWIARVDAALACHPELSDFDGFLHNCASFFQRPPQRP